MKYVALIRGIAPSNPNMSNTNLRRVIESLGYKNVQSVISSGNVIFSSDESDEGAIAKKITAALQRELSIPGYTIVRSQAELERLIAKKPFGATPHPSRTYQTVTFLGEPHDTDVTDSDVVKLVYKNARLRCYAAESGMTLMPKLDKIYGKTNTTRTLKTVERIVKKMQDA